MFLKSTAFFAATMVGAKSAFAKILDAGGFPEGRLSLYNTNTCERLTVTYRNALGEYCQDALQSLNWLFRCHDTNETTKMDLRVLEYLNRLDSGLGGGNEIHIISGYRSPAYNARLRSKSHGVAKDSYHMKGRAVDLVIPGVSLERVRRAALSLAAGGVGYYPKSNFLHIDSGNFRSWKESHV
jgi:uncharacterized protein YcbK (DUF882 family)